MCLTHSKTTVFNPQTFSASNLTDSDGLSAALRTLESYLAGPDNRLDLISQDLCSAPNLFEFVISASSSGQDLVLRIVDTYPSDPALVEASYTSTLLRRLSSVLFSFPPHLFLTLTSRRIGQYKVYVENALPVLSVLCSTDFSAGFTIDCTPTITPEDPECDPNKFSGLSARKIQKKSKRKNKHSAAAFDMAPFQKLGAKVPSSNMEASQKAHEIADDLKMILKFYLDLLLEPSLAQHLREAYISIRNDTVVRPIAPQNTEAIEIVEPKPPAYPNVQPLKAALYFENADDFGEWRITISTNATKKLRELANGDRKKCAIVVKKIKQLSNGHFSNENQKRLNGSFGVPIFEAKMQRDLRLVYQVDVVPDHDGKVERQVIKIYGIYTHTQLHRIWDAMGQHLVGKGKEYNRRCIFRNRPINPGGDVYLPASFPPESLESDTRPTSLVLSDEDMGELHSLLVLDKYITFSQAFLHSLIVNQDVQHVFELTPQERSIVECKTSCYVLGRSGTGKTTTMLFKMLGIQRAWQMQMSGSDIPPPRQIFVTKSHVLAEKVEEYFAKLLESLALATYSLEDLKKMQTGNIDLSGLGPRNGRQVNIPEKYSSLGDNHFPLFVTFDQLARMIAADVMTGDDPEVQHAAKIFTNTDELEAEDSFVTYDVFVRAYWPHFPQPLPKGLEPWLVFSEFMGVIKGSEKSLTCPDRFLDEETYCGLSARSNPTFARHRQALYALFQVYCKLKTERRHHDVADRTHAILKALLGGAQWQGRRVDYLYVDEAQDNLLIDALLLRLICRNPEGLFWAGDTAQTISAGSSFRFDDLKAFLYRIERDRSLHLIQDRSVAEPSVFQLAINYRSHGGIVNCAHSVIERITHFWPDAIDRLKPEHGIVDGLKPVFFRGWDQDTVRYEQFLFGKSGSRIELGAQQCILVRDDKALEKLCQEVGEIGLVMTLYDSKGLEFNDVLLYNFFEDSAIDVSRWSVLLNDMEGEASGKDLGKVYSPSFGRDEGRFAGVCSELKLLYVGITRARKNLWIVDRSEKSEPMRMIWTARDQVQNCTPKTGVPHFAVPSTPAEWESSGRDLLKYEKYLQAMHCFSRASLPRMAAICEAFHLRKLAYAKIGVEPWKAQQDALLIAANAIRTTTDACSMSGNDAPSAKEKLRYYRSAAECYVRGEDHRNAAAAYIAARDYDKAAQCFRKAGLFDETLEVLHTYSQDVSPTCSDKLYTVCRLFYCSKHERKRPRFPLFPSLEAEEEFLEKYDLDVARALLLESRERYMEAAELHLSGNRPFDAIRDFLKEKGSRDAIQKATKTLLDGLWERCSFAFPPTKVAVDPDVAELLNLARELPVDFVDPLDYREISMFMAIARADFSSLDKLAFEFINGNRETVALFALDHFFSHLPVLKSFKVHDMSLFLARFTNYSRLLHSVVLSPDPLSDSSIRRLFCITDKSGTGYGLGPSCILHRSTTDGRTKHSIVALSKSDIVKALRNYLAKHLRERVLEENSLCYKAPAFSQCLTFVVTERCNRVNCPREHIGHEDLNSNRYNLRLGIHLQQIHILQLMFSLNPYPHLHSRAIMLRWLSRVYDALHPQSHIQGSIADFDIPNDHDGLRVMKHWVRDAVYNLRPGRQDFVTTVLRLMSLVFAFDKSGAIDCIKKAYFNLPYVKIPQLTYPDAESAVEDITHFFDGTQYFCISAGLKFSRHILKSRQTVDLSVFCDCLEDAIGRISVSWRLSYQPPLDGLVLPRGWLLNKDFSSKKQTPITLIMSTLDHVHDLLMCLRSDAASETYMLLNTKLTLTLCNFFTSRICRALCFLAHNVRNYEVMQKVRGIFNALRIAGPHQRAYRRYVEARERGYLDAVVGNDVEAKVVIEDLVQLLHKERDRYQAPPLRLPRIKHIHFTNPPEIPTLLSSHLVAAHGDTENFIPQNIPLVEKAEDEVKAESEVPCVEPIEEEPEPQDHTPATNELVLVHGHVPTEQEILAAKKIQAAYRSFREVSAAKKIQAAYRRYRKHRKAQTRAFGKGLKAQKNTVLANCLKYVDTSNWGRTPYRKLYILALPPLIVCLDRVMAIAHEFKNKTKLKLSGDHERLEELGVEMSNINSLLKRGRLLQKEIEPKASMHRAQNRDTAALKKAVVDVKDIIDHLPVRVPESVQEGFMFVYERVVVEKQQVSKPKKLELNKEDSDWYDCY